MGSILIQLRAALPAVYNMHCSQGMKNPLDGVMQVAPSKKTTEAKGKKATGMYQYFLKVCLGNALTVWC